MVKINPYNNEIFKQMVAKPDFSVKTVLEEVPNQKVSKGLTYLDIIAFRQYVNSKQYNINVLASEVKDIFKKDGHDFVNSSVDFLMKKLNIPTELKPNIVTFDKVSSVMSYNFRQNTLKFNAEKLKTNSKQRSFEVIRHELRHMQQYIEYARCDKLGQSMIEDLESSINVTKQMGKEPNNDTINKLNFIKTARKLMGTIPDNSPEGLAMNSRYSVHKNKHYTPENFVEYYFSKSESEAFLAQNVMKHQLQENKGCLFSQLKQSNKKWVDSKIHNTYAEQNKVSNQIKHEIETNSNAEVSFLSSLS